MNRMELKGEQERRKGGEGKGEGEGEGEGRMVNGGIHREKMARICYVRARGI